jgi:hypothetical protein
MLCNNSRRIYFQQCITLVIDKQYSTTTLKEDNVSENIPKIKLLRRERTTFNEEEQAFGEQIARVHTRYAMEVVFAHRLCPFLKDPESGFGHFCIVLDEEPDLDLAFETVQNTPGVLHLVFPCIKESYSAFWTFSSTLGNRVQKSSPKSPVYAVFHPQFPGDTKNSHRLVGLLRRAPDPMIQYIPPGLTTGGTVFMGQPLPPEDNAEVNYRKLQGEASQKMLGLMEEIHTERALIVKKF